MRTTTLRTLLLVVVAGLCLAAPAQAQSKKEKERLARYDKDIKEIRSQIKSLEKSGSNAMDKLQLINTEIGMHNGVIAETARQLDSLGGERRQLNHRLDSLALRLDTLKTSFNTLVRSAYKIRGTKHWYLYVFSGDSFMQGVRRARYMRSLAENLDSQARELRETRAVAQADSVRLDSLLTERERLYSLQLSERRDMEKSRRDAQNLVNSIKKDQNAYRKRLEDKLREREALKKEIDAAIAAAAKASRKTDKGKVASSGKKTTGKATGSTDIDASLAGKFNAPGNKGKLPWPAKGYVVEHFGENVDPVFHTRIHSSGITLSVQPSAEVKAIYEGVVTSAVKSKSKFNYIVIIQHGGNYRTIYCYLDDIKVKAGDKVKTGQVIGRALVSGGTSQIFFEIRNASDTPVDPQEWLQKK